VTTQAKGAALIREFDQKRDWAEFIALNFRTFKDSIPPDEPVAEEEFRKQHQWIIEHFAPADTRRNRVFVAEIDGKYAGHVWVGNGKIVRTGSPKYQQFSFAIYNQAMGYFSTGTTQISGIEKLGACRIVFQNAYIPNTSVTDLVSAGRYRKTCPVVEHNSSGV
jgi:hypothetical protein